MQWYVDKVSVKKHTVVSRQNEIWSMLGVALKIVKGSHAFLGAFYSQLGTFILKWEAHRHHKVPFIPNNVLF